MNVEDVIKKSRNAKSRINYQHKSRIFADDLKNGGVKQYMREHFDAFVEEDEPEKQEWADDTDSPSKSPVKEDLIKADDINLDPTLIESNAGVNEFDLGESPELKKKRDGALAEPPSAAIPESKPLETPRKIADDQKSEEVRDGGLSPALGSLGEKELGVNTKLSGPTSKREDDSKREKEMLSSPTAERKGKKDPLPGKGDKNTKPSPGDKGEEEAPENPSSLLTLSILDSADSNEVNLNYYREKQTKAAFEGSYSDRDSDQEDRSVKSKSKKEKKKKKAEKEEGLKDVIDISTSTRFVKDPSIIGKNKSSAHNNTVNTMGAKGFPQKSETFDKSKSLATMGAAVKNSGFSASQFNKTG